MKIYRYIKTSIMRALGASPLAIELYYLRCNIADGKFELDEMDRNWRNSGGICCTGCMYGGRYDELCDKQARRREREKYLLKKLNMPL